MIEFIQKTDITLFLMLNRDVANPVLDVIMPYITDVDHWTIPILLIWLYMMIFKGKKGRLFGIGIIFAIGMSDFISSSVIKPWVHRLRPCHPEFFIEGGRFLMGMKKSMSFPSSHAANMGAMATYFTIRYPKTRWIVISIAVIIGYSRVYVGVHYVTDVIAGFLLGLLCAVFILNAEKWIGRVWQKRKTGKKEAETPESQHLPETAAEEEA